MLEKIKKYLKTIIIIILLIGIGYFAIKSWNTNRLYTNAQSELNISNAKNQTLKTKVDKQGKDYQIQAQILLTKNEAIKAGLLRIQELKDLNIKRVSTIVRLTEKIAILESDTAYSDTLIIYMDPNLHSYVRVPFKFEFIDKWLKEYGKVTTSGVIRDSLTIISKPSLIFGKEKQGFLKKKKDVLIYKNENPYISAVHMNNFIIKDEKYLYEKNSFWFTFGTILGGAVTVYVLTR